MNKNYCGIYKVTEENRLNPEASDRFVCMATIEGPIKADMAPEMIVCALISTMTGLNDPNFPWSITVDMEISSITDDLRGVEPTFKDGDVKVWLKP